MKNWTWMSVLVAAFSSHFASACGYEPLNNSLLILNSVTQYVGDHRQEHMGDEILRMEVKGMGTEIHFRSSDGKCSVQYYLANIYPTCDVIVQPEKPAPEACH